MADSLFRRINEFYASLTDENAKAQFRADCAKLVDTGFGPPSSRTGTSKNKLVSLMLDHARNLKAVESITEKLNRGLGDF